MPVARLTDRAVLAVSGADARTLLHNVLTADMNRVDAHGSGYGALLTPQGKILWDFIIHRVAGGYALDLRSEEVAAFAKRLMLYRLRSKAEISPAQDLGVFTAWDTPSAQAPDPRLADLGSRWLAAPDCGADAGTEDWHRHRIVLTVPEGGVDFAFGDTFPHDAAMDSLNGIAFDKGCYIGQEVVSRMRHRGTARRRIVTVEAAAALPAAGAEILAGDRPIGHLGSSTGGKAIGLVRLDRARDALDAGLPLHVGEILVAITLPYWATYGWSAPAAAAD